jgi:hypothetical protein
VPQVRDTGGHRAKAPAKNGEPVAQFAAERINALDDPGAAAVRLVDLLLQDGDHFGQADERRLSGAVMSAT